MAISYRTTLCIVQLVFFIPGLLAALWLCLKQWLRAVGSCWKFIIILALLRIIGAILSIISESNTNGSVVVGVIICNLLGIAPLTLAATGLLSRVNETSRKLPPLLFTAIDIISLTGLGTGIAGAVDAVNMNGADTIYDVTGLLQAALGLFIGCYLLTVVAFAILTLTSGVALRETPREREVLLAVAVALPLLLVRFVYASMGDFGNDPKYNFYHGDEHIYLYMSVLEEIAVMIVFLVVGVAIPPPEATMEEAEESIVMRLLHVGLARTANQKKPDTQSGV